MRLLVLATLFPSPAQPLHGLFVAHRARALARLADVRIVSPTPWFPLATLCPRYAHRRAIPEAAEQRGVRVAYPRFASVPGLLKRLDAPALARAVERTLAALEAREGWRPDAIDANLGWPDGAGALPVARRLGVPIGVTLRGVELNELPDLEPRGRGAAIRAMLRAADALFPVSDALRRRAIELGAPPARAFTVRNGVDADLFRPRPRAEARRALGLAPEGRLVLSVGHLGPRKRFDVLVEALALLRARGGSDDVRLAIVGGPGAEGDVGPLLRAKIASLGLEGRAILAGPKPPEELALWYGAADVFALASRIEGRPNVVIEALASGLPVVAVRCWGLPELIPDRAAGLLLERGDPVEFAGALARALGVAWDRAAIAARGTATTWEECARALLGRYETLVRGRGRSTEASSRCAA